MTSNIDLTHCPVCLEVFITPRALPCLHTFCELCLHEYIRAEASSNRGSTLDGFDCPTCRQKVPAPSKDSWEKWAEQFVLNHMMVSLIDERKSMDPTLKDQIDERTNSLSANPKEVTLSPTTEEPEVKSQVETQLQEAPVANTQTPDLGYEPLFFPPPLPPPPHHDHWPPPPHHGPPPHNFPRGPPHHGRPPHHRRPPSHHRPPPPPHRPPHYHGPHHHRPPGRHGHRGHCRRH